MRNLWPFLTLLLSSSAFALGAVWPVADTPRFWILGEEFGHLSFEAGYFQSRENYDGSGNVSVPNTLDRMHYTHLKVNGGFGLSPRFSVFAQADGRGLFMSNTDAVANSSVHSGNQGFGDAFLAGRWLFYRSRPTDRVYPTEWAPETFMTIFEASWNFPMYGSARAAKPALGDQSNDFTGLARLAWYLNDWLAVSGGGGYMYRTAGYAALIPWNLRADLTFQQYKRARFWLDFQSFEGTGNAAVVLNSQQVDPLGNGSLLFKSYTPTLRTASLGLGYLVSRKWEAVLAGSTTASGINAAKGWGVVFGFTYRPYQVPEIKYDEYRQRQIERLSHERREYHNREVVRYGFRATVVKVSSQGNFVKIFFGDRDVVKIGDPFYVTTPELSQPPAPRKVVAYATVVRVQDKAAYLRVQERYVPDADIKEGFEVRRIYLDQEE